VSHLPAVDRKEVDAGSETPCDQEDNQPKRLPPASGPVVFDKVRKHPEEDNQCRNTPNGPETTENDGEHKSHEMVCGLVPRGEKESKDGPKYQAPPSRKQKGDIGFLAAQDRLMAIILASSHIKR
jgi:hypothetical protein